MGIAGAGPSRRSHTKSRTGCKTCKRRHIRCDETFPQCKNCTKHQVRCDYMDMVPAGGALDESNTLSGLPLTPEIDAVLDQWQQNGVASMFGININLHAQGHVYSKADLHLLYHGLITGQDSAKHEYSVWAGMPMKIFKAAEQHPFLVHAVNAFTCLSLSFENDSADAKSAAYHQGGIALQGLQHAINNFSHQNADAVFAASILLSWQANDWRSWASLAGGIRTVIRAMYDWKDESEFASIIDEQDSSIPFNFPTLSRPPATEESLRYHLASLSQMRAALEHVQEYVPEGRQEGVFLTQLKDYLFRLMSVRPAHSAEEQFSHLYAFRKWIFWMPGAVMGSNNRDYLSLVVLAHLYATSLNFEPLYPNIAGPFCSAMVVKPLSDILELFDGMMQSGYVDDQVQIMNSLLSYPRQALNSYRSRKMMAEASFARQVTPLSLDRIGSEIGHNAEHFRDHRSPAFDRPGLSYTPTTRSSSTDSPYLEVPASQHGPILPSQSLFYDNTYSEGSSQYTAGFDMGEDWETEFGSSDFTGGFVQPQALWSY